MTIDAHQHFWRYNAAEFGWISDEMSVLRRDFQPEDLARDMSASACDGTIAVQARTTEEETGWLLDLARANPWIKGVVGWVPLAAPDVAERLDRWCTDERLRGLREVAQGQPAGFLLRPDFLRGIQAVGERGLVYDILIYENQLTEAIELVDRFPGQTFVLDHLAKPKIRFGEMEPWRGSLVKIAERPNVFCKVSGMVTEADPTAWEPRHLRPYYEIALEAFGPDRLMFGSDWPVCLSACSHQEWISLLQRWTEDLSQVERRWVWGGTTRAVYRLA